MSLSTCLSASFLTPCLSTCPSPHLSACLSVYLVLNSLSVYLSSCLFVCPSVYLCPSTCLSVCLSTCLSVCLSILSLNTCLSVYLVFGCLSCVRVHPAQLVQRFFKCSPDLIYHLLCLGERHGDTVRWRGRDMGIWLERGGETWRYS